MNSRKHCSVNQVGTRKKKINRKQISYKEDRKQMTYFRMCLMILDIVDRDYLMLWKVCIIKVHFSTLWFFFKTSYPGCLWTCNSPSSALWLSRIIRYPWKANSGVVKIKILYLTGLMLVNQLTRYISNDMWWLCRHEWLKFLKPR